MFTTSESNLAGCCQTLGLLQANEIHFLQVARALHSEVLHNLLIPLIARHSVFTFEKVLMFSCWFREFCTPDVIRALRDACFCLKQKEARSSCSLFPGSLARSGDLKTSTRLSPCNWCRCLFLCHLVFLAVLLRWKRKRRAECPSLQAANYSSELH